MAQGFIIRPLEESDRAGWAPLWRGYLGFYKADLADEVTDTVWARLVDPDGDIHGLCADRDGELLGIVHYLFHPVTWSAGPRCYLEDLYTAAESRGLGVGRALIEAVVEQGKARSADQVYWMTDKANTTARRLYDAVAQKTSFIKYQIR